MIRQLFAAIFLVAGVSAHAECTGTDLRASLDATEATAVDADVAATPYSAGRYFAVEKDGARSVLFGTFHLSGPGIRLPASLADEVAAARRVYVEVIGGGEDEMEAMVTEDPTFILNTGGPYLIPEFTEEEWIALSKGLADLGIPRLVHNQLKPWLVVISLALPPCAVQSVQAGDEGLDGLIENIARENGVELRSLETFEEVMGRLVDLPFETQIELIRMSLAVLPDRDNYFVTTRNMYADGETYRIWAFTQAVARRVYDANTVAPMMASFWKTLLRERNASWVDLILEDLEEGGVVVAAGALHLPGEDGLLYLLEQEGFVVTPLADE